MRAPKWPFVIFDLDGTLVNTIGLIIASYEHALGSVLGVTPDPAQTRNWIGEPLRRTFADRYPDHVEELVQAYMAWNAEHLEELLGDYPGTPELLAGLADAGVRVGVATSKRRGSAERTLRAAGLASLQITVAMEDTLTHKPAPEPLLLALDRVGGTPGQAAYVGDAVVDVSAARAAGMTAIAVTWGAGEPAALLDAGAHALVDTREELADLLLA